MLAISNVDKDVIAKFAIGKNAGLTRAIGVTRLDEKIAGSVCMALGMNEAFGGKNRLNLLLDRVVLCTKV